MHKLFSPYEMESFYTTYGILKNEASSYTTKKKNNAPQPQHSLTLIQISKFGVCEISGPRTRE